MRLPHTDPRRDTKWRLNRLADGGNECAAEHAADSLYIAAVSAKDHQSVSSVTGLGGTWTELKTQCSGRGETGISVWVTEDASSGGVVTANLDGTPRNAAIVVARYSDATAALLVSANTTGVDGAAGCTGGSDSELYSLAVTTTMPESVVFAAIAMRNRTHTPAAQYTEHEEFTQGRGGNAASIAIMDQAVTGTRRRAA